MKILCEKQRQALAGELYTLQQQLKRIEKLIMKAYGTYDLRRTVIKHSLFHLKRYIAEAPTGEIFIILNGMVPPTEYKLERKLTRMNAKSDAELGIAGGKRNK